jgi:hypothetical protein
MATVTLGADVSTYQTGLTVPELVAAGVKFLAARATRGTDYADPAYPGFRAGAEKAGLLFSPYHFLYAGEPVKQARHIAAVVKDKRLPITLDLEKSTKGGRPTLQLAAAVRAELHDLGFRVGALYYPRWYWADSGQPSLLTWRTWQSAYTLGYKKGALRALYAPALAAADTSPWQAYGGVGPALWQFSSSIQVPGFTANTVDGDAFRGTRTRLASLDLFYDYAAPPPPRHPQAVQILDLARLGVQRNADDPVRKANFQRIVAIAEKLV